MTGAAWARWIGCWLALLQAVTMAASPRLLDIYFEESHAGTFYHLARTLPLDEPHTLVLIDAHSDASAIAGSDQLRTAIRKAPTEEARAEVFARWRRKGTIQCFDWIEPLMPAPLSRVIWVPAWTLSKLEAGRHQTRARLELDGLEEAMPRADGELGERYIVRDWETLSRETPTWPTEAPVVVSIDLDFFASTPAERLEADFQRLMTGVLKIPGLRTLTFSLSSPWQPDRAHGERLTLLSLDFATRIANAQVHFAPGADAGPDRSRRAQQLQQQQLAVPRLELDQAGPALRSLLLSRQTMFTADSTLTAKLEEWATAPFLPSIAVEGEIASPDGWHHLKAGQPYTVRLESSTPSRVRWHVLAAESPVTNVAGLELGFAQQAPRWLVRRAVPVGEGETLDTSLLTPFLEPRTKAGSVILLATVEREGEILHSNLLSCAFRVAAQSATDTLRPALSEQFGRPYAFGAGLLPGGPDRLVANDCANFIVAALRQDGWRLPWCNPKQFAERCEEIGRWSKGEPWPALAEPEAAERGTFVHFGSHVGVLWENLPPLDRLDGNDLIAHHLEGVPEIVPLHQLIPSRPALRVLKLKVPPSTVRLVFGGDIMLGRKVAEAIEQGSNPLTHLRAYFQPADLAIANLECVASALGSPAPGRRYHFRAHPRAPELLTDAGVDILSLANNHTLDFGEAAHQDARQRLRATGLQTVDRPPEPVRAEAGGLRFAFFACETEASSDLLAAIRAAAAEAIVIVLPHWGTEHDLTISDQQSTLARQLTDAGARLIIGSGPHVRQPVTFQDGAVIAWSLGNCIFDGPGPDLAWTRGALLEVTFHPGGQILRTRQIPLRLLPAGTLTE